MGVSKDTARSEADILSTPLPGERIRQFYERSKQYWAGTAYESSGSRGKALRREGFRESAVITIATHRHRTAKYEEYKPVLEEIERIQREAELDAAQSAASKRSGGMGPGEGRHRR
jgi:uncharacterized protein YdaT